jgi:uncharacterized protein YoxC
MNQSDPTSKNLPLWIFFVVDAVLTAAAIYIAHHAPKPLSTQAIFTVTALVLAGAFIALVPLVARYEREKNETLDDRQRALEALARTLTTAAEQISIATAGLNDIADLTQKNLKKAEQLPAQLQEKIAELTSRLAASEAETVDALEKELTSLRALESERLAATAEKINQTAAQLGQLASSTHQKLATARESLAQLGSTSTQHFAELNTATTAAITRAQAAAAESLTTAHTRASAAIDEKLAGSLGAIDSKLAQLTTQLGTQLDAAATILDTKLAALAASAAQLTIIAATPPPATPLPAPTVREPEVEPSPTSADSSPSTASTPESPRRARKSRREEAPPAEEVVPAEPATTAADSAPAPLAEAAPAAVVVEPAPEPIAPIELAPPEAPPVDLLAADPIFFSSPLAAEPPVQTPVDSPVEAASPEPAATASDAAPAEATSDLVKATRKRSAKKTAVNDSESGPTEGAELTPAVETTPPSLEIAPENNSHPVAAPAIEEPDIESLAAPVADDVAPPPEPAAAEAPVATEPPPVDEFVQFSPDELPAAPVAAPEFKLHSPDATVSSMTADGASRLLATAYIGIGNRLFIRGEGPGLTWEKGVPLQFVSIGKWRWETTETTATVTFKLYKNDTVECTALGEQAIAPGHLTEVTASF